MTQSQNIIACAIGVAHICAEQSRRRAWHMRNYQKFCYIGAKGFAQLYLISEILSHKRKVMSHYVSIDLGNKRPIVLRVVFLLKIIYMQYTCGLY